MIARLIRPSLNIYVHGGGVGSAKWFKITEPGAVLS